MMGKRMGSPIILYYNHAWEVQSRFTSGGKIMMGKFNMKVFTDIPRNKPHNTPDYADVAQTSG